MTQTSCNFPFHWYKLQIKGRTLTIESRAYHIETRREIIEIAQMQKGPRQNTFVREA